MNVDVEWRLTGTVNIPDARDLDDAEVRAKEILGETGVDVDPDRLEFIGFMEI